MLKTDQKRGTSSLTLPTPVKVGLVSFLCSEIIFGYWRVSTRTTTKVGLLKLLGWQAGNLTQVCEVAPDWVKEKLSRLPIPVQS